MRDYGRITWQFWTGKTGRALRGHPEAQLVAAYLMTCQGSNMIGLYVIGVPTIAHETGLSLEGAMKGLARLSEVSFAFYDHEEETIWIPEMARFQVDEKLKAGDNRIKGIEREILRFRKSRFFQSFIERYAKPFRLEIDDEEASSSEAPSAPLPSQEHDQDPDHEQDPLPPTPQGGQVGFDVGPDSIGQVFVHWQRVMGHPKALLDKKRRDAIRKQLEEGRSVADLKAAIDGCRASPRHMGDSDRRERYDDLTLICRDAKHVEGFMQLASNPPVPLGPDGLAIPAAQKSRTLAPVAAAKPVAPDEFWDKPGKVHIRSEDAA